MKTISISRLKAHLSAELKNVQAGETIVVLDHHHPVAKVVPFEEGSLFLKVAERTYQYQSLSPLTDKDPLEVLEQDRAERW